MEGYGSGNAGRRRDGSARAVAVHSHHRDGRNPGNTRDALPVRHRDALHRMHQHWLLHAERMTAKGRGLTHICNGDGCIRRQGGVHAQH